MVSSLLSASGGALTSLSITSFELVRSLAALPTVLTRTFGKAKGSSDTCLGCGCALFAGSVLMADIDRQNVSCAITPYFKPPNNKENVRLYLAKLAFSVQVPTTHIEKVDALYDAAPAI